jgi:hypothetical protein
MSIATSEGFTTDVSTFWSNEATSDLMEWEKTAAK